MKSAPDRSLPWPATWRRPIHRQIGKTISGENASKFSEAAHSRLASHPPGRPPWPLPAGPRQRIFGKFAKLQNELFRDYALYKLTTDS
jgi:hypothetical protein